MPNTVRLRSSAGRTKDFEPDVADRSWPAALLRRCLRRPADAVGWVLMLSLGLLIVINALFWQRAIARQQPLRPAALGVSAGEATGSVTPTPRPRPADPAAAPAAPAKESPQPAAPTIESMLGPAPKGDRLKVAQTAAPRRTESAAPVASAARVAAVQRALTEFGYGQIKPSGVADDATKAALERFERERKLPVSGQISDRVLRELASVTGRAL